MALSDALKGGVNGQDSVDVAKFINSYQKSLRRRGATKDPLLSRGTLVGDAPVQRTTTGPRAGALRQDVRVGGALFHVYFHPDGKREVLRIGPKAKAASAAGTGGVQAP